MDMKMDDPSVGTPAGGNDIWRKVTKTRTAAYCSPLKECKNIIQTCDNVVGTRARHKLLPPLCAGWKDENEDEDEREGEREMGLTQKQSPYQVCDKTVHTVGVHTS